MGALTEIFSEPAGDGLSLSGDSLLPVTKGAAARVGQAAFDMLPRSAVSVPVPHFPQAKDYSCGSAALAAVASYFGLAPPGSPATIEKKFIAACKTDPKEGTTPEHLVSAARTLGLDVVEAREGLTRADLAVLLSEGHPVICGVQAWGDPSEYAGGGDGHYVVVCGLTADAVVFRDPNLKSGHYGSMPFAEWDERWHDEGPSGEFDHWGAAFTRPVIDADAVK